MTKIKTNLSCDLLQEDARCFFLINELLLVVKMLKLAMALKGYTCSHANSRHVTASLVSIPHTGAFLLFHVVRSVGNITFVLDLIPWPAFC